MTREQIIQRLCECGMRSAVAADGLVSLRGGRVAEHVYVFAAHDGKTMVVKAIRPNEGLILRVLAHLQSPLIPAIRCPQLLAEGLVVWDYLGPAVPGPLHPDLAEAYAHFQNATDDGSVFAELGLPAKLDKSGHGFYTESFHRCVREAGRNLEKLKGHAWPVLKVVQEVVTAVHSSENELAEQFGHAPFAWLHNDFRGENLVGDPPKLIDWGSSYGYGPYLYDLAPYLLESEAAMQVFLRESAIYRSRTAEQRRRDLIACGAAALMGYLHWHLRDMLDDGDMGRLRTAMERRERPFKELHVLLVAG